MSDISNGSRLYSASQCAKEETSRSMPNEGDAKSNVAHACSSPLPFCWHCQRKSLRSCHFDIDTQDGLPLRAISDTAQAVPTAVCTTLASSQDALTSNITFCTSPCRLGPTTSRSEHGTWSSSRSITSLRQRALTRQTSCVHARLPVRSG
jgi:hypothetical protein